MRPTTLTLKLDPEAVIYTASRRMRVREWMEGERDRLAAGSFWKTVTLAFNERGRCYLEGIPHSGTPAAICHMEASVASHTKEAVSA